jgi:Na+/H+-dicarboxylate symporter
MFKSSHSSPTVPLRYGLLVLSAVFFAITTGCARQANESEQKVTQKFYQHSDGKPDPFLPKKDD